eukprot:312509-Amphidinium_carterae.1
MTLRYAPQAAVVFRSSKAPRGIAQLVKGTSPKPETPQTIKLDSRAGNLERKWKMTKREKTVSEDNSVTLLPLFAIL